MDVGRLREHARALGFTPQEQVRWLAPGELFRTAIKVVLSSLFADYADRREVQAALPATTLTLAPDADGGLWFDHVADLGDGFDSTYTVARLIAADDIAVDGPRGTQDPPLRLPRGRLLVLGGDEIYPTPSSTGYEDRMKGPYRAALPAGSADPPPVLVALPGNHDWYDGLTAFLRLFAQRRLLGGWRTVQTRSYFVVQLPQRWWLVGVDTQLGTYIDDPQIRYFREHLSSVLEPGDGVIVAVPSPTWVHTGPPDRPADPDAFNALHYFEREVVEQYRDVTTSTVRPTGAQVRLWLTGDLHHYARYVEDLPPGAAEGAARQFVTCGLGGAYLLDTHRLPDTLDLPSPESKMTEKGAPTRFGLTSPWPSKERSRRLVGGVLAGPPRGLPFRNPGFWRLAGGLHGALLLVLLFTLGLEKGWNLTGVLRLGHVADVAWFGGQVLAWAAGLWVLLAVRPLTHLGRPRAPSEVFWPALAEVVLGLAGMAALVAVPWPTGWPDWVVLGLAVLVTILVTGLLASYVFAGYVALSRLPLVQGWQLSAQALEDWKGFLRLRIDPSGRLTIYPVVVDRVCHNWVLDAPDGVDGATGSARPEWAGEPPRPYLVERPVVVERAVARPAPGTGVEPSRAQPAPASRPDGPAEWPSQAGAGPYVRACARTGGAGMGKDGAAPVTLVPEQVTDVCTTHGEGVIWDEQTGLVRFVDLEAGGLLSFDPASGAVDRRDVGKVAACPRPRRSGGVIVALERTFVVLDADGVVVREFGPAFDDERIRFNDGGCDPAGRFWMGSMAYDETPGAGSVHRLDPDGSITTVLTDVTISNGLSFRPDGRSALYVDTPTGRVDVLDVDPDAGTVTGRRPFAAVDGHPDGIALDAEGGVWVALWGGSAVHRYDAEGRLTHVVPMPCSQVTCPAFGGPDLADLYITTSRRGLGDKEPVAGALFRVRPGMTGTPVLPFAG